MKAAVVTTAHEGRVATSRYCGASKRAAGVVGQPCRQPAGFRTDHVGVGRCFLHGGRNPTKHGRYSGIMRENLRTLIEQHAADPDPLDVLPELAAARGLFQDYLERYDEWRDALIAWHVSYQRERKPMAPEDRHALARILSAYEADRADDVATGSLPDAERALLDAGRRALDWLDESEKADALKPRQVLDLADAVRHAAEISKMVERVQAAHARDAVSRPELHRIIGEMWRALELHVADDATRAHVRDAWLAIRT